LGKKNAEIGNTCGELITMSGNSIEERVACYGQEGKYYTFIKLEKIS